MEETQYRVTREKLNVSLEKLYCQDITLLKEIEKGFTNTEIISPKVGYQGVEGSFSEEAAHNYFGEIEIPMARYDEFEDVFDAINKGEIDYGVLPIENSHTGEILDVYDLINQYNLYIVGEEIVRVRHNLVGVKGTSLEGIKEVYSHPQAFAQSKKFLKMSKHLTCIPYANTAMASKYIAEMKDTSKAAISSQRAAKRYGLEIIVSEINTKNNNSTRFIVLSKNMKISSKCDKVSIVFTTKHTSGALYNVLSHFAYNGVNLLKIQSRPIQDKSWHYFFFVDLQGSLEDANMLIALGRLNVECEHFRILGNYKGYSTQS
ncbi:MAG: prephenate dehydratase [Cellulosilyticaceae bacterium]